MLRGEPFRQGRAGLGRAFAIERVGEFRRALGFRHRQAVERRLPRRQHEARDLPQETRAAHLRAGAMHPSLRLRSSRRAQPCANRSPPRTDPAWSRKLDRSSSSTFPRAARCRPCWPRHSPSRRTHARRPRSGVRAARLRRADADGRARPACALLDRARDRALCRLVLRMILRDGTSRMRFALHPTTLTEKRELTSFQSLFHRDCDAARLAVNSHRQKL